LKAGFVASPPLAYPLRSATQSRQSTKKIERLKKEENRGNAKPTANKQQANLRKPREGRHDD
jgi:hypothetical protein